MMNHKIFALLEKRQRIDACISIARKPVDRQRLTGLKRLVRAHLALLMRRQQVAGGQP